MLENSGNDEDRSEITVGCNPEDLLNRRNKRTFDEPQDDEDSSDDVDTVDPDSGRVELSQSFDNPELADSSDGDSSAKKVFSFSASGGSCSKPSGKRKVPSRGNNVAKLIQGGTTRDDRTTEKQPRNPYSCRLCDYVCSFTVYLEMHFKKFHPNEEPFECEFCSEGFRTCGDLQIHRRRHRSEKPYSCDVCGARFVWESRMKIHRKTHTDEKPFACDLCDYKSHLKTDLKRHQNTHKDDKPFVCSICQRRYSSKSALKQHAMTHF